MTEVPVVAAELVELTTDVLRSAVEEAWMRADFDHERNWQTDPGVSAVFSCQRQVAYMYSDIPPSDDPPPPGSRVNRQATLGTWIHEKFLPLMAAALGAAVVEVEVFAEFVRGHLDLAGHRYVIDLKTCGPAKLSKVRNDGPSKNNRGQVMLYAKARRDAGYPVSRVGLVYVDRESGDYEVWTSPYDERLVDEAMVWFHEAKGGNPDFMPRGGRGPGLDFRCDECLFRSRCWPDAQATVINEARDSEAALESALAMYHAEQQQESEAGDSKKFAGAILAGTPAGEYGDWELTWRSTGARLHQGEAKRLLEEHGLPVPRTTPSRYPVVRRRKTPNTD